MTDTRSRGDADQHLKNIRASNGLDNNLNVPQAIVNNLEAAAKVLAEQLYQKSTHFLLELIQNADDNHYEIQDPTLHLTYGKKHLRVDCNEIGFSPKDVDAICSIGQSSKAGAGVSTQYVGEKGIGFKSVFKAADVVWVSSQAYEFKFDRNVKLGMIAPILANFPGKRPHWTSFYLQLAGGYDVQELISDLNGLDARLLIFLRRLRKIVITIVGANDTPSTRTLTRAEGEIEGKESIHLREDGKGMNYLVIRYRARNLPPEEKRDGVRESELLLAFPVDDDNQPKLDAQDVFAFLPIRDYGFKFMIQADFLLIASREDVDNSSRWNKSLRDQFVDAFLESVAWFNSGCFRYTWLRYLPPKPVSFDFFSPLKECLLKRLSTEPVLESWDEKLRPGSGLTYVPEKYIDHEGVPLTLTPSKHGVYVSHGYNHDDAEQLKLLSVTEMDDTLFLDHLEAIIKYQDDFFRSKPPEWHSRLAMVLVKIWETPIQAETRRLVYRLRRQERESGSRRRFFGKAVPDVFRPLDPEVDEAEDTKVTRERIKKLPIIPLRDGQWCCAVNNNIFFPGESEQWELPGGVDLLVVDSKAAQDVPRANLFRVVGVQDFKVNSITQLIIANHSDKSFDPAKISRVDLISQILFLYTTGWRNTDGKPFWFATESDGRALGSTIYVDDDIVPHSASKFFANNRKKFQFIHPHYKTAHPRNEADWLAWLNLNMSLSNIPRLIRLIREVAPRSWVFEMSHEFEFIIKAWSSLDAIALLCYYWEVYKPFIEPLTNEFEDASVEESYRSLKKKISAMGVKTTEGEISRLDETCLPLGEVPEETKGCVSFLDVPDPEHSRWQVLANFGVGVKQDVKFWLRCLDKLCGNSCQLKQVTYFYEQIQARSNEDQEKVHKFFHDKKLSVYAPWSSNPEINPDSGTWFPIHQALWTGPKCLRVHFSVNEIYPSCKRLFTDVLGVADASMRDLIFEAVMFKMKDPLHYMRDIYVELEKFLEKDKTYTTRLQSLAQKEVWPITDSGDPDSFDQLMSTSRPWFIADTVPLRMSFAGIVPLLAFSTDDISQMERILNGLEMDKKRLSLATKSIPRTEGKVERHTEHTATFQSKYEFIARLVQPSTIHRDRRRRVLRALQQIEVFTAERIVQRYLVDIDGKAVEGRQLPGNVVLSPEEESIKIYVKDQYLELEGNLCELSEKLASYTGIDERKNGLYLLHIVLTTPNPARISAILEHYGIPLSYPDDDSNDEWLNAPRIPVPAMFDGSLPQFGTESFTVISSRNSMINGVNGEDQEMTGTENGANPFLDGLMGDSPFGPGFKIVAAPNGFGRRGMPGDGVDDELEFIGENHVCQTLAKLMSERFNPEEQWTSDRRIRAGLSAPAVSDDAFAFTIKDTEGVWTEIIARSGYPEACAWRTRPPTWHIVVKTTRGPLADEFALTAAQFDKARKYAVRSQEERYRIPSDVILLVRVYNADKEPQLSIFLDPWELYLAGTLRLKSSGTYFGRVSA